MFEPAAMRLVALARNQAARLRHSFVGTEHLLLGMLEVDQNVGTLILFDLGLDPAKIRSEIEREVGIGPEAETTGAIPYTPRSKKVFALAAKTARARGADKIGTEHILLALVEEGDGVAAHVLRDLGIHTADVAKHLSARSVMEPTALSGVGSFHALDFTKRYDLHCIEAGQPHVYQNVLFKGLACLSSEGAAPTPQPEFLVIELENKELIYIARSAISKFHEHTPES